MAIVSPLYNILTFIVSILLLPFFALHSRGRIRLGERFGFWNLTAQEVTWFHGASFGEVEGLLPLIRTMRTRSPSVRILVTATSPTGLTKAAELADWVRIVPFDSWIWIVLALRRVQVQEFISAETELWPGLTSVLAKRNVRLSIVNGKISDFSYRWYRLLRPILKPLLQRFSTVCVENESYHERFVALGAAPDAVMVTGTTKYDRRPSIETVEAATELRTRFFGDSLGSVLVLGSIRPGEDEFWFSPLSERLSLPFRVVIAPRHQEKFEFFAAKLDQAKLPFLRYSTYKSSSIQPVFSSDATRIVLLDTLGDLEGAYAFSDVAFIGATLIPGFGGHNPLEAAAYGSCVCLGPHTENITEVLAKLRAANGVVELNSQSDCIKLLDRLNERDSSLAGIGHRGQEVWSQLTGATERVLAALSKESVSYRP